MERQSTVTIGCASAGCEWTCTFEATDEGATLAGLESTRHRLVAHPGPAPAMNAAPPKPPGTRQFGPCSFCNQQFDATLNPTWTFGQRCPLCPVMTMYAVAEYLEAERLGPPRALFVSERLAWRFLEQQADCEGCARHCGLGVHAVKVRIGAVVLGEDSGSQG